MASTPTEIGRYRLLEEIGAGGFGRVYRAEHVDLGLVRAIKVATDPEFVRQLRKEGTVLARLRHPRIVEIYDMDVAHDPPYVVMEYVEGEDLRKRLDQGPLPVEHAVQIMLDVLEALGYAHGEGVIHRDIKPSNILLDKDGRAKISDFGLGRLIENLSKSWARVESVRSGSGDTSGTLKYMSPEQLDPSLLKGQPPDHRSDLYSFGLVFYETLTGEFPAGLRPPVPSEARPGVYTALDSIFAKCVAGKREQRCSDAGEASAAIRAAWAQAKREERERQVEEHSRKAQDLLAQERFEDAVAEWERVLALDPTSDDARKGTTLARQRQTEAQVERKRRREHEARQLQVEELARRAEGLFSEGRYEENLTVWQQVLTIDPRHTAALHGIEQARQRIRAQQAEEAGQKEEAARTRQQGARAKWMAVAAVLAILLITIVIFATRQAPTARGAVSSTDASRQPVQQAEDESSRAKVEVSPKRPEPPGSATSSDSVARLVGKFAKVYLDQYVGKFPPRIVGTTLMLTADMDGDGEPERLAFVYVSNIWVESELSSDGRAAQGWCEAEKVGETLGFIVSIARGHPRLVHTWHPRGLDKYRIGDFTGGGRDSIVFSFTPYKAFSGVGMFYRASTRYTFVWAVPEDQIAHLEHAPPGGKQSEAVHCQGEQATRISTALTDLLEGRSSRLTPDEIASMMQVDADDAL